MLFQIFDLHHARIREEQEAAVKAQKAEAARIKREKTKVVDFDHHYQMIDYWLLMTLLIGRGAALRTIITNKRLSRE
jgi:hypothetical protein